MLKIVILAPIKTSPYSLLVTHLLSSEPEISVTDIIVRTPWNLKRFREEIQRDGTRLLKKVYKKIILRERAYDNRASDSIYLVMDKFNIKGKTLFDLARFKEISVHTVRDHNHINSQKIIEKAQPDIIAFTGGGIIRKNILVIPKLGVLNCHMGILPKYRGMDVIEWPAIENEGDKLIIGLTLHFMDKGIDTGPILLQRSIPIKRADTFETIRTRFEPVMVELMVEGIKQIRDQTIVPKPQFIGDGRQYYLMHPRMLRYAEKKLNHFLDKWQQEHSCEII